MKKWRVINIGIPLFFEALQYQDCEAVQIDWRTPVRRSSKMEVLLERINAKGIREKVDMANEEAVNCIIGSDPAWIDILPAGDVVEGLSDYTIVHSGPPISYEDMVMLHQRGLVSACLFEGWAKNEEEAVKLIRSGKLKIMSALDTNTVGAGTCLLYTSPSPRDA